jgi:hypothetical protein
MRYVFPGGITRCIVPRSAGFVNPALERLFFMNFTEILGGLDVKRCFF